MRMLVKGSLPLPPPTRQEPRASWPLEKGAGPDPCLGPRAKCQTQGEDNTIRC